LSYRPSKFQFPVAKKIFNPEPTLKPFVASTFKQANQIQSNGPQLISNRKENRDRIGSMIAIAKPNLAVKGLNSADPLLPFATADRDFSQS
jgi:hypothetical protein